MKTAELSGVLLDLWAARAEGLKARIVKAGEKFNGLTTRSDMCATLTPGYSDWWQPFHVYSGSAGPIIERERIEVHPRSDCGLGDHWGAVPLKETDTGPVEAWELFQRGETPWVAAMRVRVATVYGPDVPDTAE